MNTKTNVISQAELDAQFACCDKIAAYWQTKGRTPTAYVETYGCQQNEADSEKLRGFLAQCGYAIVGSAEGADVVIMNTCAIREHAEQRVFGNLGALTHTKRRHPEQKIFLCGCMAGETKVSDRVKHSRKSCGTSSAGKSGSSLLKTNPAPSPRAFRKSGIPS